MTKSARKKSGRVPSLDDESLARLKQVQISVNLGGQTYSIAIGKRCKKLGRWLQRHGFEQAGIISVRSSFAHARPLSAKRGVARLLRAAIKSANLTAHTASSKYLEQEDSTDPCLFVPGADHRTSVGWLKALDQHAAVMIDKWGYASSVFHPAHRRNGYVYVVRLTPAALEEPAIRQANPDQDARKPCVYVGSTGLSPEERFCRHKKGIQASRYVKRHGLELMPRLYTAYNPMPSAQREDVERQLAERLRKRGYAVWQG